MLQSVKKLTICPSEEGAACQSVFCSFCQGYGEYLRDMSKCCEAEISWITCSGCDEFEFDHDYPICEECGADAIEA